MGAAVVLCPKRRIGIAIRVPGCASYSFTFGHVSRRVFGFGRCKRCAGNGDNRRQCNGSCYADLPHESPPKGVASWQTEMSTLLLTPWRVTCGAAYEQPMNKKFQQGRGSVRLNNPAATAARHVWRKRLANFRQTGTAP